MVKMAEQRKLHATIQQEVQLVNSAFENLHGEVHARGRALEHAQAECAHEVKARQAAETDMADFNEHRLKLEAENVNMRKEKEECYFRLQKIEAVIEALVRKYTDGKQSTKSEHGDRESMGRMN